MMALLTSAALPLAAQQVAFTYQPNLLKPIIGFSSYVDCALDMNGDFLDDVVRVAGDAIYIDYQQPDGTFQQKEFPLNVQAMPDWSICGGDLDNNGFNDLLFGNGSFVSFVKANADGSAYTEALMPGFIFSQRSTMADINNDGWLDGFVCHDVDQSIPYRNTGDGAMVVDYSLIQTIDAPGNYAAIWTDYDNDADIDLYVTKCKGGAQPGDPDRTNRLYRNNGDGTFSEVGALAGVADNAQSWSTVFEDFDNDGDFDAFIVNHDFQNRLYRNNGDGTFTDVIVGSGINPNDLGAWENASGDFNNDGYMDIFSELSNNLYLGNGDLTFSTNPSAPFSGGGIGDFNNDGFLDVIRGDAIIINNGNDNNWLKINTIGNNSNRNGIGARVEIHGDFGVRIREVRAGQSFSPMSSLTTHFGIGQHDHIDLLVIKWPSGVVTSVPNPAINTTINVQEFGCLLPSVELTVSGPTNLCPGNTVTLSAPEGFAAYNWSNGETTPSIVASAAGNYSVVLSDTTDCVAFSNVVAVSMIEEMAPVITVSGELRFCEGGVVTLTASEGANHAWSNGMTGQSITVEQSGVFSVAVDALCSEQQIESQPVEVEVLEVTPPVVMGTTIVQGDSVLLSAQGENCHWYDAPSGGTPLGVGDTYQTPPLNDTQVFYVETHHIYPGNFAYGGKPDNTGTGGIPTQGGYLLFDAWEEFTLRSVTVYVPNTAPSGIRRIQLFEGEALKAEASVFLDPGQHEIELDFEIPVGSYSLRCPENNLFRNNGTLQYPYSLGGLGEITTSVFGDMFYYYFYNWKVQKKTYECISERVPVEVSVTGVQDAIAKYGMKVFPNPSSETVMVRFENLPGDVAGHVRLSDNLGRTARRLDVAHLRHFQLPVADLTPGIYHLQITLPEGLVSHKIRVE
jgi:hypothetical protein